MFFPTVLLLVVVHSLEGAAVNKSKGIDFGTITFPVDDQPTRLNHKPAKLQEVLGNKFGESDVPESCKDQSFCTIKPPNYPEEKFNDLFKDYKIPPMPTARLLDNRFNDLTYNNGCEADTMFEPLYKVRPKRDVDAWRNVVQSPKNAYVQSIRIETCKTKGSCFKPLLDYNPQVETACMQMYTVWEILVETADGKGTETIGVELPTCCSCMYKEVTVLSRFGGTSTANKTKA